MLRGDIRKLEAQAGAESGELQATLQRIRQGQQEALDAKSDLVNANLRLVVSVARTLHEQRAVPARLGAGRQPGPDAGGREVRYRRGFKFSTYATWWVMQSVSRALGEQARTIRIPIHMNDQLNKFFRASRQMERELGRAPADDEFGRPDEDHRRQGQ